MSDRGRGRREGMTLLPLTIVLVLCEGVFCGAAAVYPYFARRELMLYGELEKLNMQTNERNTDLG